MAEPEVTGTPQEPVVDGGTTSGTSAVPADGGQGTGLSPDQKALMKAWEEKAAAGNAAIERARALEARLAEIERAQYGAQNPFAASVQQLQERAQYGDTDAAEKLTLLNVVAAQQAEINLTSAIVDHDVPAKYRAKVKELIRQSGYRMDLGQAVALAAGTEAPVLHEQLKAKDDEIRRLREIVDNRTVGGSQPKASMSTPAAAAPTSDFPDEMDVEDAAAILRAGGDRAAAFRRANVKLRAKP